MRKMTVPLAFAATAALITVAVLSMTSGPVSSYAQARAVSSYAEDRAAIEDLQARYLFALDFHDPDLYVSTFTEDGVLDICAEGCAVDDDCTAGTTCIGEDADGDTYCTVEPTRVDPCESDDDCGGYGVCDTESGSCYCDDAGDCTGTGVDACYEP